MCCDAQIFNPQSCPRRQTLRRMCINVICIRGSSLPRLPAYRGWTRYIPVRALSWRGFKSGNMGNSFRSSVSVVAASRLWELGDKLSRVLGQRRDTQANEKWSGRWESNPRLKLGKLGYYHYTTPAPISILVVFEEVGKWDQKCMSADS